MKDYDIQFRNSVKNLLKYDPLMRTPLKIFKNEIKSCNHLKNKYIKSLFKKQNNFELLMN